MDEFLVAGGVGFIGSNICRQLVSQGCFVRVIGNLLTGKKDNPADIKQAEKLIGFEPTVPFEKGLNSAVARYRDNLP